MSDSADNPYTAPAPAKETKKFKLPIWFWIVGVIALLWNLMGLAAFAAESSVIPTLPESQQELYRVRPLWAYIAFAVAVIAGTLGCVLLLMRRKLAITVFIISLLGVLAQQGYAFFMSDTFQVLGNGAMAFPILITIIAAALIFYSIKLNAKGWLR